MLRPWLSEQEYGADISIADTLVRGIVNAVGLLCPGAAGSCVGAAQNAMGALLKGPDLTGEERETLATCLAKSAVRNFAQHVTARSKGKPATVADVAAQQIDSASRAALVAECVSAVA